MTGIIKRTATIRKVIQDVMLNNKSDTLSRQFIADKIKEATGHSIQEKAVTAHLRAMGIKLRTAKHGAKYNIILDVLKRTKGNVTNDVIHNELIANGFTDISQNTLPVWVKRLRAEYKIMSGQIAVEWEKEQLIKTVTEALAELKEQGMKEPKPGVMLHYLAKHKDTYISAYILAQTIKEMISRKEQSND